MCPILSEENESHVTYEELLINCSIYTKQIKWISKLNGEYGTKVGIISKCMIMWYWCSKLLVIEDL
jgi:hypothetical protein